MSKVIIIGAGPSALFAAKTILENSRAITVDIFEQGNSHSERYCAADQYQCQHCSHCATIEGIGGAGLFSDGKLVLDLTSGGKTDGISALSDFERHKLEKQIRDTFIGFDGVSETKEKPSEEIQDSLRSTFREKNLDFKFYNVLHMGTQNLQNITTNFVNYLFNCYEGRFNITPETNVTNITKDNSRFIVATKDYTVYADVVIAAVGKSGAQWLKSVLSVLGCTFTSHDFFFGFRMEMYTEYLKALVEYSYDPKICRIDSNRKIKVHCVCRNGKIRYSRYRDLLVVGGHSPFTKNNDDAAASIATANFNILLSYDKKRFSVDDMLSKFRVVCNDKVLAQTLSDFIENRTSVKFGSIVPPNSSMIKLGNIRSLMDSIDIEFSEIVIRFLTSLAELCPGIMDNSNILYAPAIEWDMDTVTVDQYMETEQENLFAVGDGAGLSQGIVYSAATGIIAARKIITRLESAKV